MKALTFIAASVCFSLLGACSGGVGDGAASSSAAESTYAHKGDKCGGSALDARQCASGLTCTGVNPSELGSTGTCRETSADCDSSQEPAACPGGGSPHCSSGQWACAPLPSAGNDCDPSQEPAACPGGGSPHCSGGQWACAALPTGTDCDPSQEPAACPGGGAPQCSAGQWACAALPTSGTDCDPSQEPAACPGGGSPQCSAGQWACAPIPSCVPDGQASQSNGTDCCSGNYDSSTNNCGS